MKNLAFLPNDEKSRVLATTTNEAFLLCVIIQDFKIVRETEKAIFITGDEAYYRGGMFNIGSKGSVSAWIPKSILTVAEDDTYWVPEWFNSKIQFN